jgi:hypothetical protein
MERGADTEYDCVCEREREELSIMAGVLLSLSLSLSPICLAALRLLPFASLSLVRPVFYGGNGICCVGPDAAGSAGSMRGGEDAALSLQSVQQQETIIQAAADVILKTIRFCCRNGHHGLFH